MTKIKKACKGALYPKSSSVSSRLKKGGSFPDLNKDGKITKADILKGRGVIAKKGMKMKKAQDGDKLTRKNIKSTYESSTNPKLKSFVSFPGQTREIDTTGYAGGKKEFPLKVTRKSGSSNYSKVGRSVVDKSIKKAKAKTGAKMTKKCMYGCK